MTHTLPNSDMVMTDASEHLLCEVGYAKIIKGTLLGWTRKKEGKGKKRIWEIIQHVYGDQYGNEGTKDVSGDKRRVYELKYKVYLSAFWCK